MGGMECYGLADGTVSTCAMVADRSELTIA